MTILQVNTVADENNAVGKVVGGIHRRLSDLGLGSRVAYGRGMTSMTDAIRIGSDLDVIMHTLGSRFSDSEGLYSQKATRTFIKKIEREEIDVVHLHNIHGHFLNYQILFDWIKRRDLPVVWTLHDCWTMTGHCASFAHLDCKPGECCFKCRHLNEYPESFFSAGRRNLEYKKKAFSGVKKMTVVSVSPWLKQMAEDFFPAKAEHIVIENGVDAEVFRPLKTEKTGFTILAATANWEPSKGLDALNRLANVLRQDETLRIAGNVMSRKVDRRIVLDGRMENVNAMVEEYNRADLFLSPAMAETFGMTTVEAMLCDVPVIVNNRGALPGLVTPRTGLVADFSDVANIREAIDQIRKNRAFYSPRNGAVKRFDLMTMADRYVSLYQSVK